MSDVDALRARLIAELEAATSAAVKAADVENARPIAEAGAPDAAGVLAALAHVAHYNQRYDDDARTVAKLTRPADWPLPTAEALAAWLLGSPEALPLAVAVAEAARLTPADAWTDRERWANHLTHARPPTAALVRFAGAFRAWWPAARRRRPLFFCRGAGCLNRVETDTVSNRRKKSPCRR